MGTDFKCGCRTSFGDWFLCDLHENWLVRKLVLFDEEEQVNDMKKKIKDEKSHPNILSRRDTHGKFVRV